MKTGDEIKSIEEDIKQHLASMKHHQDLAKAYASKAVRMANFAAWLSVITVSLLIVSAVLRVLGGTR